MSLLQGKTNQDTKMVSHDRKISEILIEEQLIASSMLLGSLKCSGH
jgi:hypothetical protein